MTSVECPECGNDVELPSGLAFSGIGDNPGWKGVSCPFCPESIPKSQVKEAFQT